MLKQKGSAQASLWVRNIQLSLVGGVCAATKLWLTPVDREWVQTQGFFGGWTNTVTMVWFLGSAGGLIVAGCKMTSASC